MQPAAVLAVIVKAQGISATNAQLKSVQGQLARTEAAGVSMASGIGKAGSRSASAGAAMSKAGRGINRNVGIPLLAVSALSAKAAIDFEDSFADIRKTVNATPAEFKKIEHATRRLAKEIPISVNELNRLGGQAGALGIKSKSLIPFIKTAAELGTTTDMSSDEAANALARLANIMGTKDKDFRRMASTFVDLGNKGASTEQEIANMALRLAGTGQQVGLTESQVLSFSSALASVGVRAEAGGSAFSKVFAEMQKHVLMGTKKVDTFGEVAGMSATKFTQMFKSSPDEAMLRFIEGLDKIKRSGGNVFAVLEALDLKDIRIRDSLLRAAGAGKLFREQLSVGSREWKRNVALTNEARKRYGTTAAEIELAKNKIVDFGISLGQKLLPIVAETVDTLEDITQFFALLPDDVQITILKIAALTAALGIVLSLGGKLVTAYSQIPKLLTWITTSTVANTTATQAQAIANAELAASAQAAALAQRELLIANKSGVVTGSIPIGGSTLPMGGPAGKLGAKSLMGGLARALPWAAGVAGLGNIIYSATKGDMEQAGFKSGGALVGGIIGAVAGKSPQAAMLGAGLGSFAGGLLGDLFGGGEDKTAFQENMAKSAGRVSAALERQAQAANSLRGAHGRLANIGKRQQEVSQGVKRAEDRLAAARRSGKAGSPEVRKAEAALAIWKGRNLRLTKQQYRAERLHGIALWGYKQAAKAAVIEQRERVGLLREEKRKSEDKLLKDRQNHAGLDVIQKDFRRLNRVSKDLRDTQGTLGRKLKEVSQLAGEKYAKNLKNATLTVLRTGKNLSELTGPLKRIAPTLTPISEQMKRFGQKGKEATGGVKKGFKEVKGALGPFQSESHLRMRLASEDVRNWKKASLQGVGKVETKLGTFADQLGITGVTFGTKQAAKEGGKKQRGGPITVPGTGTGDTVPLMAHVEPGEVIHVLNSRASKDRKKLAGLEALNNAVPRFQSGGTLGVLRSYKGLSGDTDFLPAMGFALSKMATGTGTHISVQDGYRSVAEQAALYQLYLEGKGNLAARPDPNSPHPSGNAADITPGRSTFGSVASNYGLGFTVGSEPWHIELLNAANGALGSFAAVAPKMPKTTFTGPPGMLTNLGQGVMDAATKTAQMFLNKNVGAGGVGSVATGPVKQMAYEMVQNIWGSGQWNPFQMLEMSEAGWDYTAVNPSSGAAGLAQALPPSKYPPGAWPPHGLESAKLQLEWMMGYIKERYSDPAGAWAFHQANNWYQKGGTLAKGIKNVVTGIRKGTHLPKYKAMLKKVRRRIDGIGLSDKRLGKMDGLSKEAERYSANASNASALTESIENPTTKEEEVIHGIFKGQGESAWLNAQLSSLLKLRGQVIGSHGAIEGKQLPRVTNLLKDAKNRLRAIQKAIRAAEDEKRRIEKKIKEIEQAQKKSKETVESEIKELERSLNKAQGAKKPDHKLIDSLRGQIKTKRESMSAGDEETQKQLKKLNEEVDGITRANKARVRGEGALKDGVIPSLTGKQEGLHETMASLYGDGGEVKKYSFLGLQSVQGPGGPFGKVGNPPAIGELGGEIFNIQNRLREIAAEANKVKEPEEIGESDREIEIKQLEAEIAGDWRNKYLVSQSQFATLAGFPSVAKTQGLPYAGSFAKGGVMMAEVGEKGREFIAAPQGSRVIPKHEANAALASSGDVNLTIENITINEDGTADVTVGGKTTRAEVKNVNRKEAKGAAKPSPGSRRRGR